MLLTVYAALRAVLGFLLESRCSPPLPLPTTSRVGNRPVLHTVYQLYNWYIHHIIGSRNVQAKRVLHLGLPVFAIHSVSPLQQVRLNGGFACYVHAHTH